MEKNELFPVFLKVDHLRVLLVGGGNIAFEKLKVLVKNYPDIHLILVADSIGVDIFEMAENRPNIQLLNRKFFYNDLEGMDIVMLATNDFQLHQKIVSVTRQRNMLVNVADTPELCDFYLGAIVQKGDLKIAISTNGKSPTLSKRLKEFLEDVIPEHLNDLIQNLGEYRSRLKGDFQYKVNELNKLTRSLLNS